MFSNVFYLTSYFVHLSWNCLTFLELFAVIHPSASTLFLGLFKKCSCLNSMVNKYYSRERDSVGRMTVEEINID